MLANVNIASFSIMDDDDRGRYITTILLQRI